MGLYFKISIYGKGALSIVEIIIGILGLVIPISYITRIIVQLASGEIGEYPTDFLSNYLLQFAHQLPLTGLIFISIYLLMRGFIKLVIVIAIIKNQLWAYPSLLVLIGLFLIYQLYEIVTTRSIFLIGLTIFDFFVLWFTWREYQVVRSRGCGH